MFTAGVAPQSGSGTPTGSVAFLDGSSQIGMGTLNAGSASFSSSSLSVGNHSISAAYSGDSNYVASSSAAINVTVTAQAAADYSLTMSNSTLAVAKGTSGTLTITLTPKNGFKQAVGLACSGLPAGATCSFNPPNVNPVGGAVSTTLTVEAASASGTEIPSRGSLPGPRNMALYILAVALVGIVGMAGKRSALGNMRFRRVALATATFAGLLITASCAGVVQKSAAQPASYMITVTASAANAPTHTQQFTLTVMP
jgi:large repetitive protein